jgi:uncharacterized protein YbbC (DUF1343 family)
MDKCTKFTFGWTVQPKLICMRKQISFSLIIVLLALLYPEIGNTQEQKVKPGAADTQKYFPLLRNRSVAVVANNTSRLGQVHLVDTLLSAGIKVKRIFVPEHGFRGDAEAGEELLSCVDAKTGIQIISLYGKKVKPTIQDLKGIDIVVFDIQDVGARFFTYLSTLHYIMESCAEHRIPLLLLDRPNPNGFYVDGPVLEEKQKSFVGLHPIPIIYGMTIGEYAGMLNGENWLKHGKRCKLTVITCKNYDHNWIGDLPVKPSPNLTNLHSILLYPSTCLFEGTILSLGRGTEFPFEVFGHPQYKSCDFAFTPRAIPGMSKFPTYMNQVCCGVDLRNYDDSLIYSGKQIVLDWLVTASHNIPDTIPFFNDYFDSLAGNSILREQLKSGVVEAAIRESWKQGINNFKIIRKKYLLYPDFE